MGIGFTLGFVDHSKDAPRDDLSAVAALEEPTRRRLYEHVARSPDPVGRDEAAQALGLARQTAAFHLDRLADAGLLDVVYERRSGRTGPGAGRPAKLYRRSQREVGVSLPARCYELAGRLLAQAVEESDATGEPVRAVLHRKAAGLGERLGSQATAGVVDMLERYGFEPRREGETLVLGNCPFHALARDHTETVCGMNLHLLRGALATSGDTSFEAHLAPAVGRCCVVLEPAS
ncbi:MULTISPECIES: helix-turn-helix domain-containing protein [unclassified Streptomyces]|uniref:helix-turn-helix transcriptional regulator n=1 Tax=unclassified Streptomyces TaxID=2593676 RepID=UPI0023660058|nr:MULTISPECIES: helix-turn-helix domain-containing protein [unclassified Streptomyces]MDF3144475.1 helix-turn-helix domain-containing protein [Streptomyces sp. T21Q-yed]WDF43191.1 helix-turn-helix domain-containing protein [Streptomyces sp. T12]